jgi:hypothetical protein
MALDLEEVAGRLTGWLRSVDLVSAQQRGEEFAQRVAEPSEHVASVEELLTASLHEAAHGVVGHLMGLQVQRACLRANGSGSVEYRPLEDNAISLAGQAVANLAGPAADLLRGVIREGAGSWDLLQAAQNLEALRKVEPVLNERLIAILSLTTVVSHWDLIARIAAHLRVTGELDGPSIRALCGSAQ